jgi:serine/threonine-protein kinase RsbW
LRLAVRDDGPGFDWKARQSAGLPDLATSGRGIALYTLYADRVAFNEAGNAVVLCRRLREPSGESEDD